MRVLASATTPSQLQDLSSLVASTTSNVGAPVLVEGDRLTIPLDVADQHNIEFSRSLIGYPTGRVPVVRGFLEVGHVTSSESFEPEAGMGITALESDGDELVVRFSPRSQLRVVIDSIEVALVATDDRVGEQALHMAV